MEEIGYDRTSLHLEAEYITQAQTQDTTFYRVYLFMTAFYNEINELIERWSIAYVIDSVLSQPVETLKEE